MRKISLLAFAFTTLFFQSCLKDKITRTYTIVEAVYKSKAEVLAEVKGGAPQLIANPGKIYLYGNYLFLNDINQGVHIIDNSNPASPQAKAFIKIPGNVDIAVKGTTLYADVFTDMLVLDIANPLNIRLQKVVPSIFPERLYVPGFTGDTTKYIVDWIEKRITESVDMPSAGNGWIRFDAFQGIRTINASTNPGATTTKAVTGIAGSMARFSIINNYMYAVNRFSLNVIDISDAANPVKGNVVNAGMDIETIYPFKNKLFLGASSGMHIFNINTPSTPVREGSFIHARACDPVVADDNYAYVTLRAGTFCQGTNNQLDVINVQNVTAPSLLKTYPFTNPHGLSKDGNLLFICDGADGLKIYNATVPSSLQQLSRITNINAYDVIADGGKAIVVAKGGLYQYSYSNPAALSLISKISVGN